MYKMKQTHEISMESRQTLSRPIPAQDLTPVFQFVAPPKITPKYGRPPVQPGPLNGREATTANTFQQVHPPLRKSSQFHVD